MRSNYYTLQDIEENCRCAGIFLTRDDRGETEVLLVESHRKKYQFSFPKGKRNRGEDTITAAKRELFEETGIDETRYKMVPGKRYVEFKQQQQQQHQPDDNKPHIVYYAARLQDPTVVLTPQDTKEIRSADWFTPAAIYTMRTELYLQRRQIVTKAIRDLTMKKMIHGLQPPPPQSLPIPVPFVSPAKSKNFSARKMLNGHATRPKHNGGVPIEFAACSSSSPF